MKKKIIDLTIGEARTICNNMKRCSRCPLYVEGMCALSDSRWITAKGLNKEVDVNESNTNKH